MSGSSQNEREATPRDTNHSSASRRAFLGAAGAAATTGLAGCTGMLGGGGDSTTTLRVTVWSGNYVERFKKAIKPIFESRFDAELEVLSGWNSLLAKIKSSSGAPPFDVTVACEPIYYNGRKQGLFEPLRYDENIPNIDNVIQHYKDIRPISHGAPVDGAPLAILYNKNLQQPVETWSDFTSPTVKQSSGVGIDSGFWIYPLLGAGVGTDAATGADELYQEQYHDELLTTLEEWPIQGWASSGTDIWQQFQNGIIDAAQWYFDQIYYDIDKHENVEFSMPANNAAWMDNWAVVSGTNKRTLGEEFINMLLDPEVQSKWSEDHPLFFSAKGVDYAGDLGEYVPTTAEEAEKYSIPHWKKVAPYSEKFSNKFTRMQTN
ncbi:PotD/PotF family extracellular solute-binding protein [Salarchaeum sp. JOR-1]|uniref:ABC transporter substrate-binding protein n=1 Tax=Salarchaeum sp. JOR-1 TaxID=2599399 RepID=UPI001198BDB7|nr:extracellular solute-binding protein [Salarchaeum sp. JOR-1]QDX41220.1 extracellular solute-binding protein [Salarchaeum sp. JOR-1]